MFDSLLRLLVTALSLAAAVVRYVVVAIFRVRWSHNPSGYVPQHSRSDNREEAAGDDTIA